QLRRNLEASAAVRDVPHIAKSAAPEYWAAKRIEEALENLILLDRRDGFPGSGRTKFHFSNGNFAAKRGFRAVGNKAPLDTTYFRGARFMQHTLARSLRLALVTFSIAMLLTLAACGGSGMGAKNNNPPPPTGTLGINISDDPTEDWAMI